MPMNDPELCEKCNLHQAKWFLAEMAGGTGWGLQPAPNTVVGGDRNYAALCQTCFDEEIVDPQAKKVWWQPKSLLS